MWDQLFQELRRMEESDHKPHLTLAPGRSWPSEPVRRIDDEKGERLELALTGLYGGFGVLPDYFTDELLMEGEDREGMRAFLDIFNQRFVMLLFETWGRYRFFTDPSLNPENKRSRLERDFLNRLAGILTEKDQPIYLKALKRHKIALYRRSARTGAGLRDLLQTFLPGLDIDLEQFVVTYRPIPRTQFACLGSNVELGSEGNFVVGERIKDIGGAYRLVFRDLDYETFMNLSPGGAWRKELESLVGDYTRGQLDAHIRLELRRQDVPAWRLGSRQIGRNLWLRSTDVARDQIVDTGVL